MASRNSSVQRMEAPCLDCIGDLWRARADLSSAVAAGPRAADCACITQPKKILKMDFRLEGNVFTGLTYGTFTRSRLVPRTSNRSTPISRTGITVCGAFFGMARPMPPKYRGALCALCLNPRERRSSRLRKSTRESGYRESFRGTAAVSDVDLSCANQRTISSCNMSILTESAHAGEIAHREIANSQRRQPGRKFPRRFLT